MACGDLRISLTVPAWGQVRKLHTRDLTRLSQVQVADYLKRSDIIFIPVGAVETNGIMPSDRDYARRCYGPPWPTSWTRSTCPA